MIWLVGAKGMLGQEVAGLFEERGLSFCGTDRDTDITNLDVLRDFARDRDIDWIVNCSAYTAVDRAEEEREAAFLINEKGVENLGRVARELDARVIHLSTDYVFPGTKDASLEEDEPTGPTSVYGESKLAGERALLRENPRSFIIRTAWLYGEGGNNFVSTMLRLMGERESLKIVDDQIGSPTWTGDLAALMAAVIESDSQEFGVYHFSGEGRTSWFGFAREIYRQGRERGLLTKECVLNPCTSDEYPTPARRPAFSLLSKGKVISTFNRTVLPWEESLNTFFERGGAK
ncbi:MAG: dTDP-4-dehydrorhamnose reductase [Spirochaetales bacterium]|nr:dTDP-4-dehydrorhamnose reductase [Spirochaetales bacterium]